MVNEAYSDLERRYAKKTVYMLTGGLEYLIDKLGGYCRGFSVRSTEGDALLVIRVDFEGKAMVGFVGSATVAGALCKLHDLLRNNKVVWREDAYDK